ncbi:MAG: FHA domain-containing protein [Acidobacteriota bacterium]
MTSIPRPKLTTRQGDRQLAEREISPGADLTLGRGDQVAVRIDHRSVSELHARIFEIDGRVYLEDLDSRHGTFVAGLRVERRLRLRHGQTILLGQHETLGPVVLHFDDRANALLDRLGVPDDDNVVPFRGAADDPPSLRAGDALGDPSPDRTDDAVDQVSAPPSDPPSDPPSEPLAVRRAIVGSVAQIAATARRADVSSWTGGAALGLLGLVVLCVGWLAVEALRPASVAWRAVQLAPPTPLAGGRVTVTSPDIEAWDEVAASIDGRAADVVEIATGRMTLEVPPLPTRAGGDYEVRLVVHRGVERLVERRMSVRVRPSPERLVPARVAVGQAFAIEGRGLGGGDQTVQVWVDGREAEVIRHEPGRIEATVPDLDLETPRTAQVELRVGTWRLPMATALWLEPPLVEIVDFDLQPTWDAERSLWRLAHPFGGGFWIGGAAPATAGELPQGVVHVVENWRGLFAAAADDSSLRVEVEAGRGHLSLVTRGDDTAGALVTWPRRRLAQWQQIEREPLMAELYCYTMAREINDLLEVFARGRELPSDGDGGSVARPYVPTLNRLVNFSRLSGRDGRPTWRHVDKLGAEEQLALAGLLAPGDGRLTPLGGRWDVMLENVFFPDGEYRVEMALELESRGRRLSGEARVALKSETMALGVEPAAIEGRLRTGERPEIVLELEFDRPIGKLVLVGELDGRVIDGRFVDPASGREARWRAVRAAGDASTSPPDRGWGVVG